MRRYWVVALAVLTLLGVLSPPAFAQAPAPKVTISGLIDMVGTYDKNMSTVDVNLARNNDKEMNGRTRGRFDIIGEIGQAKAVLGLEIDALWGQTGFIDSNGGPGCATVPNSGGLQCGAVHAGSESSFDLNTDTQTSIQVKWLYTEFPVPLIPWPTVMRLGAQPFGTAANYKLATYANGDFPGVNIVTTVTPNLKLLFTYVAVDENMTGKKDYLPFFPNAAANNPSNTRCSNASNTSSVSCVPQSRGDNFALIFSAEYTPMKGLDIKPMYSYFFADGLTSGAARQGRGGLIIAPAVSAISGAQTDSPFAPTGATSIGNSNGGVSGADGAGTGIHESRHTIGTDIRWRSGPWSLDPTFMHQMGTRQGVITGISGANGLTLAPYGQVGTKHTADINAWLVDIRGGYQVGPWNFQGMYLWTSGNRAQDNLFHNVNFFQPLDTDTSYQGDWGTQIYSLGLDYYNILNGATAAAGLNPGVAIGYDKYGRHGGGLKADYNWTPALRTGVGATAFWTDKSVDTDSVVIANGGLLPSFINRTSGTTARPTGDSSYLGTELNGSLTWRFAPGLAFDWAIGYLFAGGALGHRTVGAAYYSTGTMSSGQPNSKDIEVNDVITTVARVRYTF